MKEVQATDMGVYGGSRRRKGERFLVKDKDTASWYTPVDKPKAKAQAKA